MTATITTNKLSWHDICGLLDGLWPDWSRTPEETKIWEKALKPLNPEYVAKALERVYVESSYKTPKLRTVLAAFNVVHREAGAQRGGDTAEARRAAQREREAQIARERDEHQRYFADWTDEQLRALLNEMNEQSRYWTATCKPMNGATIRRNNFWLGLLFRYHGMGDVTPADDVDPDQPWRKESFNPTSAITSNPNQAREESQRKDFQHDFMLAHDVEPELMP